MSNVEATEKEESEVKRKGREGDTQKNSEERKPKDAATLPHDTATLLKITFYDYIESHMVLSRFHAARTRFPTHRQNSYSIHA